MNYREWLMHRRREILSAREPTDPGISDRLVLHIDLDTLEDIHLSMDTSGRFNREDPLNPYTHVCGFRIVLQDHTICYPTTE